MAVIGYARVSTGANSSDTPSRFDREDQSAQPSMRLRATRFMEEPLELVLSKGFKLNGWNDLVKLGFIDHPDGISMATRFLSRQFPGASGIRHVPRTGFSNYIALILEPVALGLGFTVLQRFAHLAFSRQG